MGRQIVSGLLTTNFKYTIMQNDSLLDQKKSQVIHKVSHMYFDTSDLVPRIWTCITGHCWHADDLFLFRGTNPRFGSYVDAVDGVQRKPAQHEEEYDDGEVFGGLDLFARHLTSGTGSVAAVLPRTLGQVREKRHAAYLRDTNRPRASPNGSTADRTPCARTVKCKNRAAVDIHMCDTAACDRGSKRRKMAYVIACHQNER